MRLLATGDVHIGAGYGHRVDALADTETILDQIAAAAREHEVDAVLLAGDVFHRPKPTPAELHVFARFAAKLDRMGLPVVAVLGNAGHDQMGTDLPTALELFDTVRVSRIPERISLDGVDVVTLPSVPIARLAARYGFDGDRGEVNEAAAVLLVDAARELRAEVPAGRPCVLLGHWSVSGAALPNGLPVADLHEPVLDAGALDEIRFDAVVMGHIHRGQAFSDRGFYVGSPMCHDFGEAGFDHGVWILDVNEDEASVEFVPLVDRRFVTVAVDLAADLDYMGLDETDAIAVEIFMHLPLTDAVVRVSYTATEEQHRRVDHQALLAMLADNGVHRVHGGIAWSPVRAVRARVQGMDESLDPAEAVDAWCAANDVDADPLHELTRGYLEKAAA